LTGERQTQRLREKYVHAILSQEIGWFDSVGATELSTKVADVIGKVSTLQLIDWSSILMTAMASFMQIGDGMGRKMGDMIQYIAQVVGSFVIGFYLSWRLTVVLLASFPLIACAGAFMIQSITSASQQSLTQYAKAGMLENHNLAVITI
jgi:ATP-binding cassette, subfamily B (MDR/TAP), member 1